MFDLNSYKSWLQNEAFCIDCGKRYSDRKRDNSGVCIDPWATETQCWTCFTEFGSPEKRGKPNTMHLSRNYGIDA
jgi:hypothetical protein